MSYAVINGPVGAFNQFVLGDNTLPLTSVPASVNFVQIVNDFRLTDLGNYAVDAQFAIQAYATVLPCRLEVFNVTTNTVVASAAFTVYPGVPQRPCCHLEFAVANAAHVHRFRLNVGGYGLNNIIGWLTEPMNWSAIITELIGPPSALTSGLTDANKMQNPAATPVPPVNFVSTGITLGELPADHSHVEVFINGVKWNLAGDRAHDCYFSADGGATAKALNALVIGDTLYWNALIAGFSLLGTEQVDMVYAVA